MRREKPKRWLRHILAIPFLQTEAMVATVTNNLSPLVFFRNEDFEPNERANVDLFFNYVEMYWLQRVGPAKLSVYGSAKRTNEDVEAYHRNLGRRMGIHANVWTFLGT